MPNATPHHLFNLQLTRQQLALISKLLDQELNVLESGHSLINSKLLKRTHDVVWQHLKPTPEQQRQAREIWIRQIYGNPSFCLSTGSARPMLSLHKS